MANHGEVPMHALHSFKSSAKIVRLVIAGTIAIFLIRATKNYCEHYQPNLLCALMWVGMAGCIMLVALRIGNRQGS
jgi:hypothetical protein